jgi:hypothetical protein
LEVESLPGKGSLFRLLLPSGPTWEQKQGNELGKEESEIFESHSVEA